MTGGSKESGRRFCVTFFRIAYSLPYLYTQVSEEKTAELSGDTSTDQPASVPAAIPDDPVPISLDVPSSLVPDSDALSQSEGLPEGPAQSTPDPDSFSDSYTHITPSSDEAPASLLSTETLGGVELTQEKETLEQEGAQHPLNGEGLQPEEEESDLSPTDLGKQAGMNYKISFYNVSVIMFVAKIIT